MNNNMSETNKTATDDLFTRWIYREKDNKTQCSYCHRLFYGNLAEKGWNYCPVCGAKEVYQIVR